MLCGWFSVTTTQLTEVIKLQEKKINFCLTALRVLLRDRSVLLVWASGEAGVCEAGKLLTLRTKEEEEPDDGWAAYGLSQGNAPITLRTPT